MTDHKNKLALPLLAALVLPLGGCLDAAPQPDDGVAETSRQLILEPQAEVTLADPNARDGETAALYRTGERASFVPEGVSGTYALSLRAKGDAYEGWPALRLEVDGEQLSEAAEVSRSTYEEVSTGETYLTSGQVVEAIFTNDNWGGSPEQDRNLYVDHLALTLVADAPSRPEPEPDTRSSCTAERLETDSRYFPVWTSDVFEGEFCREIVGDGERLTLSLDAEAGGFDTAVVAPFDPVRVDDLPDSLPLSATISVQFSGSGVWWAGPKFSVREGGEGGKSLVGNYENYVVENASRTPRDYHERLTQDGTYLGETRHDGSVYKHYRKVHKDWEQFWAVRQDYRERGSVDLANILALWRGNGLPNKFVRSLRVNVETYRDVEGTLVMKDLSFPAFIE